jgi:hypothetical protein
VARAVVRAIRHDVSEIIVSAGPIRLFAAVAELSPWLGESITRWVGAAALLRSWAAVDIGVAEQRARRPDRADSGERPLSSAR